jgi:hypothetical protein
MEDLPARNPESVYFNKWIYDKILYAQNYNLRFETDYKFLLIIYIEQE